MKEPSASEIAKTVSGLEAQLGSYAETLTQIHRDTIDLGELRSSERDREALRAMEALRGNASLEGRLCFEGTLGEGGMGIVRAAVQLSLGRTVAVKTLREGAEREQGTLEVLREAWAAGALEHPNVVPIHDLALSEEGTPILIMKRIDGSDWASLMHEPETLRERFGADDPLEWNLRTLMQVCHAVAYAHERGIVHRDLKPENVMVGRFGEVFLVDWGLAVSLREQDAGRLRLARDIRHMAGTPCYMAPEMLGLDFAGRPIDERTDVYLLGGILFEILSGGPPHQGTSLHELVRSILAPEAPRVGGPRELAALARRALHPDPESRPQSAGELRAQLQAFLQRRASSALTEAADQRLRELREVIDAASVPREVGPDASAGPDEAGLPEDAELRVHALFAQCRFGYHAALSSARGHEGARAGLREAICAMVRYELRQGKPAAAQALLAELEEPDPELQAEARELAAKEASERLRLKRLGSLLDTRTGAWARILLIAVMGVPFVLLPLRRHLASASDFDTPWALATRQWALFSLAAAISYAARRALSETLFNRRLVGAFVASLGLQAIAGTASAHAGIPHLQLEQMVMFGWAVMASLLAITVEWRLWPVALSYLGCFLVATIWAEQRYLAMTFGNLVLVLVALLVWVLPARRDPARAQRSSPRDASS
ncbi:MAG: serine/threonine protein kinase [Myxococcales bacterium]|nr:serine/threonine protein kinase [Myxococcales bacterium]